MSLASYQDRHNPKPFPLQGMSRPLTNNAEPEEQQLAMLIVPDKTLQKEPEREGSKRPREGKRQRGGRGFAAVRMGEAHEWPVEEGIATRISSHFGFRKDPFTGKRAFHAGIDIPAPVGTGVLASADGVVETVATHARLGKYIKIKHDEKTYTLYGHLKATLVKQGQKVEVGDKIGRIGSSGRSTGPHLDFSIRKDGKPVNPTKYLEIPASLTASAK